HPLIRRKTVTMEQAKRVNRASCEQCRMCTDMCPRFLLGHATQPHKMMRAMNYNLQDLKAQEIAQLCCQCNLCNLFSCPAGLYPKDANNFFRAKLAEQNIKYKPTQESFEAREARKHRLVPSKRLIARIGLSDFDRPAPMTDIDMNPEVVHIATRQHVGAPAVPVVSAGDRVCAGQVIGSIPQDSLGAAIHASIAGTVVESGKDYVVIRRG
ncbi:MAG: 4Fe-4S dicluster domain-containing protein, partial [Anaerovoracaceae bacterium]